jgi:carbonic anhydrase
VILGMQPDVQARLLAHDHAGRLAERVASSEAEIPRRLPRDHSGMGTRLNLGVASYRRKQLPRYQALFRSLAEQQHPHTLFVTCADSRIVPNLITDSDPGELFIMRNVGNIIPPFSKREMPASAAGVEYAIGILGVTDVVVCGHSRCGAIGALRNPGNVPPHLTSLHAWLSDASSGKLCQNAPAHQHDDDVARANAVLQLENLRSYEVVKEREAEGKLRLHAWFFDIGSGDLETYDFAEGRWVRLGEEQAPNGDAANDRTRLDAPAATSVA